MGSKGTDRQVDRNYDAFLKMLPQIMLMHMNKFVLMKDGESYGFYSTLEDAYMAADKLFPGQEFSVQKVTNVPVDLGFFSHAADLR